MERDGGDHVKRRCGTHVFQVGGEKGGIVSRLVYFTCCVRSWEGGKGWRRGRHTLYTGNPRTMKPGSPGAPKVQQKGEQSVIIEHL